MCALSVSRAHAQPSHQIGLSGGALRGLDRIGLPVHGEGMAMAIGTGYGFTERFDEVAGTSHRVLGRAAISGGINDFLALAAEVNGHLDAHPGEAGVAYVSAIGEPRLSARLGFEPTKDMQLGGELSVRFPGTAAPSLRLEATTAELLAQLALLHFRPLTLHAHAGFRLDNSEKVAPDLSRLRAGDRVGLGLSSAHQALLAIGAHHAFSDRWQAFAEASWDLMVEKAKLLQSPLRLGFGGRYGHPDALSLELLATFSLSRRPDIDPRKPLIPIEPRVQLVFGIRYAFQGLPQRRAERAPEPRPQPPKPPPPPPTSGPLWGTVADGFNAPLANITVRLSDPAGGKERTATSDERGHFEFTDVPFGPVQLTANGEGFEEARWSVEHGETQGATQPQVLLPSPTTGQLRGVIRSWNSEPLAANVRVKDSDRKVVFRGTADTSGKLALDLPPGRYEIHISAPGQQAQTRRVRLRERGVTILNVDLRPERRRKR